MARPTKYDETRVAAIIDNLKRGNTRRASSIAAGISEDTLAAWLKRYPDFAAQVKKAEAEAETAHVANINRWAAAGNWQASAWWLERRHREDWGRRDQLDVNHRIRQDAERLAAEHDLDAEAIIREAERIVAGRG